MAAVYAPDKLLTAIRKSGLLAEDQIDAQLADLPSGTDSAAILRKFIKAGLLTKFQANCLAQGKYRNLIIASKYKVLDYLGDGGMGQVFLAEHLLMKRQVALKVPPAKKLADPGMLARFIREARALAALDHPNIVRAFDLEQFGRLYMLAMEYVDGPSLRDLVAEHGPRQPGQAAHYIAQAAQGLQHAHEAGWVHRDIKPANLLVDPTGVVKVLDLGLAFLLGEDADSPTRKFDENAVLGTADYLAPEQAIDSHQVDIRADIYSLGATLYFLLTGRALFDCSTVAQKLLAHQVKDPPSVGLMRPDVPVGLRKVLAKMLAKDPADRYQTPAETAKALMPFASDADLTPPPRAGKPVGPIRRIGEPSLASTLHTRATTAATRRGVPALGPMFRRLLTHPDWRVKAGAGAAAGVVLVLTGMLSAYVFRGHKVSAAGTPPVPPLAAVAPAHHAGERLVFQAHSGPAECVRILPDGRFLTGGDDRVMRLWDASGRQVLKQFHGHTETLRGVHLVPTDSRLALSTARDGTIRLWNLEAGTEVRQFLGHVGQVWWADVSPDGRLLLSCGQDKTIRLWDLRTGAEIRRLVGHTEIVTCVAFLPDGRRAVSCSTDRSARLWDTQTGAVLSSITLPAQAYRLTLAADGRRVVLASRSSVQVWDVETAQVIFYETVIDAKSYMEEGRFSPDGHWLLAGGSDGGVRIWDVTTGRDLPIMKVFKGKILEVVWAADGRSFAVSCSDGTIRVWSWPRGS
ncbi:MAG TPA: serine/threonine-protein kinase [Gemmataceae bacterium]|jgi:serine/threonine protein kinase